MIVKNMKQKQEPPEQKAIDRVVKKDLLDMARKDYFIPTDAELKDLLKEIVDEDAPKVKC